MSAFTDAGQGGNPAGVVLEADALTPEQKQTVAAKVGLSETAFVSRSRSAAFKLEFFTPTRQIPHCGHATIATFCLLRDLGRVGQGPTSKETIDGNRAIVIDGEMAFMEQRAPRYTALAETPVTPDTVLTSLGVGGEALRAGATPVVVDTGNAFLVIPLSSAEVVRAVMPLWDAVESVSEQLDLVGLYLFSTEVSTAGRDAGARMFAPRYGIREESATGMAGGGLACFLYHHLKIGKDTIVIEQGRLMQPPSPSLITVKLDLNDGAIRRLLAGGAATRIRTLEIEI